jgi:uncharacterized membrane protein
MISDNNGRGKAIAATAAILGVTAADVRCAMQLGNARENGQARNEDGQARGRAAAIANSITIQRNADEIYAFWSDFNRLPEIFDGLESAQVIGGRRSYWKLRLPLGRSLEWDAEITDDQPNSRIAWRSWSSSAPHSGEVRFEPAAGQRGTKVIVRMRPEGMGASLRRLFGIVPEQQVNIALHNLKQLLETGEIIKSDASIHRGMHSAQPPDEYLGAGEGLRAAASV